MESLLNKTRVINELLQQENTLILSSELPYNQITDILGDVLDCNVYILGKDGTLLGYYINDELHNKRLDDMLKNQKFPKEYIERLLLVEKTTANISIESEMTVFPIELREQTQHLQSFSTIVPIFGAGERLGTILLGRISSDFDIEDLILAEYSATVVGMQILYQKSRVVEKSVRDASDVKMSIGTLSYSELKAVKEIFKELGSDEGTLTASTVADKIGITRSVIVNALRKLESAGIIETRSLGMKGTYIKIINPLFKSELEK